MGKFSICRLLSLHKSVKFIAVIIEDIMVGLGIDISLLFLVMCWITEHLSSAGYRADFCGVSVLLPCETLRRILILSPPTIYASYDNAPQPGVSLVTEPHLLEVF